MTLSIQLPNEDGSLSTYNLQHSEIKTFKNIGSFNRTIYAAAHVVVDAKQAYNPADQFPVIDWERTMAYRHHLWQQGFGVAEAMDTAQRGMGIEWSTAKELIKRTLREMSNVEHAMAVFGAGTDHLSPDDCTSLEDIYEAYMEQMSTICQYGGHPIIMASRALAKLATSPEDYIQMYQRLIAHTDGQVILHWLGEVFDPALRGYFGSTDIAKAMQVVLAIIHENANKIEGIKVSLLEEKWEIALRKQLPEGIKMYTGDDFNYDKMIAGDGEYYSHALLGIFDAIAPVAASALSRLALDDLSGYFDMISPTIPLSKKIFENPTPYYKAGVVFLAWLNGHQDHFVMAGGMQSMRSIVHYADLLKLADQSQVLSHPSLALHRMQQLLALYGIEK